MEAEQVKHNVIKSDVEGQLSMSQIKHDLEHDTSHIYDKSFSLIAFVDRCATELCEVCKAMMLMMMMHDSIIRVTPSQMLNLPVGKLPAALRLQMEQDAEEKAKRGETEPELAAEVLAKVQKQREKNLQILEDAEMRK